ISVCALVLAIVVSFTTKVNVGVLSIALAWIIGVYLGHMPLATVTSGFPVQLFLMLAGVTMLFTQAQNNGTLDRIAHHAVKTCRGNVGLIPIMFFLLAAGLASIGPGSIAMAALIGPMAMRVAGRAGISAFLMTIMVGNGANAGSLSPIAPTGIIVNGLMAKIGITGVEWPNYFSVLVGHATVAFAGYFLFGGLKLFRRTYSESNSDAPPEDMRFERPHWITVGVIAGLILAVIAFGVNVGMAAFACDVLMTTLGVSGKGDTFRLMPWGPIMMVSGVTVLIALLEKTQGMELFTSLLAKLSTKDTVTGVIAFVTGLISVYSSTSGVVLPAFLPAIPGLVEKLGGGDPLSIAWSMCVGAHLVDISPLSTTGALCIASAPLTEDHRALFNKLLAWGLAMSVVGAVGTFLVFGLLR
ncbi:MAG: SLC13 family permease, partial [Bryobacteraceae bacterium]